MKGDDGKGFVLLIHHKESEFLKFIKEVLAKNNSVYGTKL